ncbi:hypothetical protein BKA62DRAFT_687325 [Auriculariales sp. MPI-PUGE-AT-0066]|nr:hypothetical protein BKA62DRAFT_687325 [Auriculariales sp. MPI-PUGE-AT-0066]
MPDLLDLPQELIDRIVECTLVTERSPPSVFPIDITEAGRMRHARDSKHVISWRYGPENVCWEQPQQYKSGAQPLLLVNRTINASTTKAVDRIVTSKRLTYKLDIAFVDEKEVWPTWICVPALAREVDHVDVTIRIVGADVDLVDGSPQLNERQLRESSFTAGDGSPPQLVWCFYYLMEQFFHYGPSTRQFRGSAYWHESVIAIHNLYINVTPAISSLSLPLSDSVPVSNQEWLDARRRRAGRRGRSRKVNETDLHLCAQPLPPRWLALHDPTNLNYTNPTSTFGHIQTEKRLDAFTAWKAKTIQLRADRGLR